MLMQRLGIAMLTIVASGWQLRGALGFASRGLPAFASGKVGGGSGRSSGRSSGSRSGSSSSNGTLSTMTSTGTDSLSRRTRKIGDGSSCGPRGCRGCRSVVALPLVASVLSSCSHSSSFSVLAAARGGAGGGGDGAGASRRGWGQRLFGRDARWRRGGKTESSNSSSSGSRSSLNSSLGGTSNSSSSSRNNRRGEPIGGGRRGVTLSAGGTAAASSSATSQTAATTPASTPTTASSPASPPSSSSALKPSVVFVLGGPGSGKGTQSALLAEAFDYVHLSAGELLREERTSGSPDGQLIDSFINEGKIVPVALSLGLLQKAMVASGSTRFLIDGFPRNQDNLEGWTEIMGHTTHTNCVLFLDCPEAVLEDRLLKRASTEGRSDDNLVTARKRFATYVDTTLPVVHHFEALGLVCRVDAQQGVLQVFRDIKKSLSPFIEKELVLSTAELEEAVAAADFAKYKSMCADDLSIAGLELAPEGEGEAAQKAQFETDRALYLGKQATASAAGGEDSGSSSSLSTSPPPSVRLMGKSAVVVTDGNSSSPQTRVWQLQNGSWKVVHCHSSGGGTS